MLGRNIFVLYVCRYKRKKRLKNHVYTSEEKVIYIGVNNNGSQYYLRHKQRQTNAVLQNYSNSAIYTGNDCLGTPHSFESR